MILALIFCYLSVFVAANPFHKYPFVFLLDIGNEELEKTNSEQIRVSVPGGSVALRYPATGFGNTISHVRVSGIDFGTDLKANIVDGGPGYKYVVLVFMGNPGVPYDAVVTVQTVDDSVVNSLNIGGVVNSASDTNPSEEDANNSAEDLNDTEVSNNAQSETYIQHSNAELTQSSSNVYSYAENESMGNDDDDNDDTGEENEVSDEEDDVLNSEGYIDQQSNEETVDKDEYDSVSDDNNNEQYDANTYQEDDSNVQVRGIDNDNGDDDDEYSSNEEQYSSSDYSAQPVIVDSNLYSKYVALKDHLNFGGEVYSQEDFQKNSRPVYQEDPLDYEDVDAAAPVYDDEEINGGVDKHRDSHNNNYVDSDESYAVAY